MKIVSLTCPQCGAALPEGSVKQDGAQSVCPYCGTSFVFDAEKEEHNVYNIHIDNYHTGETKRYYAPVPEKKKPNGALSSLTSLRGIGRAFSGDGVQDASAAFASASLKEMRFRTLTTLSDEPRLRLNAEKLSDNKALTALYVDGMGVYDITSSDPWEVRAFGAYANEFLPHFPALTELVSGGNTIRNLDVLPESVLVIRE